ncbi:MAG TPA: DUF2336 domain-containing protein [Caulobacteraceae bacterium]|jgi:uncharacterized protein (DUF2336 family)|nr:DUF2336 domain-containing protein [Caulobacteraceae bacterium]
MSEALQIGPADIAPDEVERPRHRARLALLKRLADVISLPLSRVNSFERSVTADLLVEILRDADFEERARIARRISTLAEIPDCLIRLILHDDLDIAYPLLADSTALTDADLLDCARHASGAHRRLIAQRRGISEVVAEALVELGETLVVEALLRNDQARLSPTAIEAVLTMTQHQSQLVPMLLRRPELRPNHAYVLFWWADADARRTILQRFAVSREVLQEAAGDVFPMAADEGWQDGLTRKALQFIERRQRNRAAIDKSPYDSLEAAISAAEEGMSREIAEEISYLAGIKPMTGAKILADTGGEGLAVLCKATGLQRPALRQLWRALRRPDTTEDGQLAPALVRITALYDMVAVDRAQTVLRYWNWSLSSAMTPALIKAIREEDDAALDEFSVPQRSAMLAFGAELKR